MRACLPILLALVLGLAVAATAHEGRSASGILVPKGFKVGDETVEMERAASEDEPFSALAFKIMSDQHLGKLTYIRIYSGTLTTSSSPVTADSA